ncbi:MAG: peptide-methionine (R)-S-oxide reductase MsrB [Proteobacteria bacterium]|nr:peptide-methionine (R)-S-oxide reductase MsrB [Pseudomonadota bacterium]
MANVSTKPPSTRSASTIGNSSPTIRSAVEHRDAEARVAKTEEKYDVTLSDAEWRQRLSQEQYAVLRRHGTERAGTSPLDKRYDPGTYVCAGCGQKLFSSETKYDSRSGWPSFWKPLDGGVGTSTDHKLIYPRTEVHCSRCGGHLGHVFEDGPAPTGERYCMNGVALKFEPKG